jgi:hypothetical protein
VLIFGVESVAARKQGLCDSAGEVFVSVALIVCKMGRRAVKAGPREGVERERAGDRKRIEFEK